MRHISDIALHCAATREGQDIDIADVRRWHKAQGWSDVGYHFFYKLDGTEQIGRPVEVAGAHVSGHNARSIGLCYAGGVAADGKTPKDTRTPAQKAAMERRLRDLKKRFPAARIRGHRDFPGVAKACPSFDVAAWLKEIGL